MVQRDRQAVLSELVIEHGEQLRRFLRTRVQNAADVPDLVQEVFLRVLRVPQYDTIRMPEAYIFTIARHVAQQYRLRTSMAGRSHDLDEMLAELRVADESDPALEVSAQQCVEQLDQAFTGLSPKIQATFLLYRRDGLSMDEISERLGVSRPMAKKYLAKALIAFRKRLKESE